jgi:hypothetical protein
LVLARSDRSVTAEPSADQGRRDHDRGTALAEDGGPPVREALVRLATVAQSLRFAREGEHAVLEWVGNEVRLPVLDAARALVRAMPLLEAGRDTGS